MSSPLCEAVARFSNRDHELRVSTSRHCTDATPSKVRHHFAPSCKLTEWDSAASGHVRFHTYTRATVRHV